MPAHTLSALAALLFAAASTLSAQCVNLTALNSAYTENFDSLASTGTSSTMPPGWFFAETGTNANALYSAGTGSGNTGDTYSFGNSADRALGGLRSGSLVPTIGACFTNSTGQTIARLSINYTGEQWRLGTLNRPDQLQFQYSTNATTLASGVFTAVAALHFNAPVTGPTVGAIPGASANLSSTIVSLNIAPGATFWIRWSDFDATGADDGLAVDNFSLTPLGAVGLSISDLNVTEGNSGTTTANVTVTLAEPAPAGGVTFDIATADGTATAGSDYVARALTGQTIAAGQTTYTLAITILGDSVFEPDENFTVNVSNLAGAVGTKTTAAITIVNDDIVPISAIQGFGSQSPYNGQLTATTGIVTALKSNGFFLQTPAGSEDSDPATSEGIFVFTSSAPPPAAAVGNLVRVSGAVAEFRPSADPLSPPITEITGPAVTLLATGQALPPPILLTPALLSPSGPIDQLERFEGMRVRVDSLTVTGPTGGSVSEANATSTSDGAFYGVLTGTARPFREPGIEEPDPLPVGSPCCVPRFDSNPERLRVDSDAQPGAAAINVTSGAVVANLTGPLDYGFRTYTIVPDPLPAPAVSGNIVAVPVPLPAGDQFTVAAFNMERFFDTVNDPGISDVALTAAALAGRLNKASLTIRTVLRSPDILAVEEMENLATLQALATKLNADAVAAAEPNPNYSAYLTEGNDPGGIDVGFLVKVARVTVVSVTQEGAGATYIDPNTNTPALLNDRPPLVLRATVQPPGGAAPFPLSVIVNHLRSLNGIDDAADGNRVRTKRAAQAEFLANLVQARQTANPSEGIVVVGDFNAFQFNDGYVDLIGTIRGTPTSPLSVVKASPDLVNPNLADAADSVSPAQRYSYVFGGNAQTLDHVLVTQSLLPRLAGLAYGRSNSDFPEILRGDFTRPERLSDHDAPIAYFTFPKADLSVSLTAAPAPITGQTVIYSITVENTLTDAASNVQVTFPVPSQTTLVSFNAPGWACSGTLTVTCTKASLSALASETLTVTVTVACALANGSQLTATATALSQTLDPDLSNNTRTIQTAVSNPPPVVTPPVVSQPVLWPPNGKYVDVTVSYSATDTCGAVACTLSVASNEPVNGRGDGNRSSDWEVVSPNLVRLRAERSGAGTGRVYTITVTCRDTAGNTTERTATVTVPKSQGQ